MPKIVTLARAALALVFSMPFGAATAHDTYLFSDRPVGASPLTLGLTSAHVFPGRETGPKAARVARFMALGPDAGASLSVSTECKDKLGLKLEATKSGTYVAAVALHPREIDLKPEEVAEYLAEIEAPDAIRQHYDAQGQPRLWTEVYTKHSKALVCVAPCSGPDVMAQATGLKAEFILARDAAPGTVRFELKRAGKPVPSQSVALTNQSGDRSMFKTDRAGMLSVPVSMLAQPVLLSAVLLDLPTGPGKPYTSDFVTLTLYPEALAAERP